MSESRTVHVGEESVRLQPFRAFKAMLAGDILAGISENVGDLVERDAAFREEYRTKNKVRLSKENAAQLGYDIPKEEFGPDGIIELPAMATGEERFLNVFKEAFELARTEVVKLLGLVVIANAELQQAEADDKVEEVLEAKGKELMFAGDIREVMELAAAAAEVVKEQLSGLEEVVGKIRAVFQGEETEEPEQPSTIPQSSSEVIPKDDQGASDDEEPSSSTDSPPSTDGAEENSSSESATESLPL